MGIFDNVGSWFKGAANTIEKAAISVVSDADKLRKSNLPTQAEKNAEQEKIFKQNRETLITKMKTELLRISSVRPKTGVEEKAKQKQIKYLKEQINQLAYANNVYCGTLNCSEIDDINVRIRRYCKNPNGTPFGAYKMQRPTTSQIDPKYLNGYIVREIGNGCDFRKVYTRNPYWSGWPK